MLAIANYVDEDGHCWPSAGTLARDTDQTEGNVRRLLKWLEEVGVIVRLKRWRTDQGAITYDPNGGRQTSDEIRLCLKIDHGALQTKLQSMRGGNPGPDDGGETSDIATISPGKIDTQTQDDASSSLGSDAEGAYAPEPTLEESLKERKDSPNPPSGGGQETIDEDFEKDLTEFAETYPAPIADLPRLRAVMAGMVPPLRRKIVIAAKGYANFIGDCSRRGKARAVKDAHRWVSGGMWQGYVASGAAIEKTQLVQQIAVGSEEGRALEVLHQIAHISAPREFGRNYQLSRPLSPPALALAKAPPSGQWVFISAENPNQCQAWTELIVAALAGKPRPVLVSVWPRNPAGKRGFMAPWSWPPRKDGSLYTGPPTSTAQNNEDDDEFVAKHGLG